jgi:hypothetical protein
MEYNAAVGAGQTLKLKVFRYLHGSIYLVVAHDGPRSLTPGVINTFEVSIPVQAGDVIGLNDQNASTAKNACEFQGTPGDSVVEAGGDAYDGAQVDTFHFVDIGVLLNVSATLTRPDRAPASGPTGQRAAALARCKKRSRKHHWSKKRLKKCKRKARLLPA